MACVGGCIDVNWLVLAAACCVRGLVLGGGRGGVVWGWRFWWWGGRGWVLCWLGVWASLWVVWVLRVCAVMYYLAKWTQRTWGIPTNRWVWVVTLRPQQREAPPNRRGPTPPRPTTLQLCPYMVAARLMTLLWPGPDTPTQNYPHLTEEEMPSIQRCFFQTLDYLQQTHPHVLEQIWPPPG